MAKAKSKTKTAPSPSRKTTKSIADVAKPGKTPAQPTTRPIVVSRTSIVKDPMVSQTPESTPEELIKVTNKNTTPKVLVPVTPQLEDAPATAPELLAVPITEADSAPEPEPAPESIETPEEPEQTPEPISSPALSIPTSPAPKPMQAPAVDAVKPAEDSSAAVIDVVAGQADLGKKQKTPSEEETARQEAVKKLLDEKTYILPIKQRSGKRSSNTGALVVLALLLTLVGAYVAADMGAFKLPFELPLRFFKPVAEAPSDAPLTTVPPATTKTPVVPKVEAVAGVTTAASPTQSLYANKDLAVQFTYPKAWGDVTATKTSASIKGNSISFTFSKQPLVLAGMLSRDYEEAGKDGVCYAASGIYPKSNLAEIKSQNTAGDSPHNDATFAHHTRILKDATDGFIYEQFETGAPSIGACPRLTANGYRSFATSSTYTGIQFFWGDATKRDATVAAAEMAKYKANPNNYFADADRQAFIAATMSVKTL